MTFELRSPPKAFVDISTMKNLRTEILYATRHNFTGAVLPGYSVAGAWLRQEAAEKLSEVLVELQKYNLGLHVWDAYRPQRATQAMVEWAEHSGKNHLLDEGYIARKSRHNSGAAIDLNTYDLTTGLCTPMGTDWDCFTADSHTHNCDGIIRENRLFLQSIMSQFGFEGYSKEWWHFQLLNASSFPSIDVPYGVLEPLVFR